MRAVFVTGTDTEIGKTFVSAALLRALARRGLRVAGMKPIAAGAEQTPEGLRNEDALALMHAANVAAPYELVNPYCLPLPASPHIAAREAGVAIDVGIIRQRFAVLARQADCMVVEGAGGWLAPISVDETMADVASALKLPVLLVVGLRLGCLNHTLLTAQAIAASGLRLAGWIGNHIDPQFAQAADNLMLLESKLGMPPLAVMPHRLDATAPVELPEGAATRLMEALRQA